MRAVARLLFLGGAALSGAASGEDRCVTVAKAEQARIEQEFTRRAPGGDPAAQQRWSRELHAALADVEKRERQCQDASRPKPGSAEFQQELDREQQCSQQAKRRLAEINSRYRGRPLGAAEQTALREEEDRAIDERMQCLRQLRR